MLKRTPQDTILNDMMTEVMILIGSIQLGAVFDNYTFIYLPLLQRTFFSLKVEAYTHGVFQGLEILVQALPEWEDGGSRT